MLRPNPLSGPLSFIPPLPRAQPGSALPRANPRRTRQGPRVTLSGFGCMLVASSVLSFEPCKEGFDLLLIGSVDRRNRLHPVDLQTGGHLCWNVAVGLEQPYGVDGAREFGLGGAFPKNRDLFVFIVRIGGEDLGEERAKGAVPPDLCGCRGNAAAQLQLVAAHAGDLARPWSQWRFAPSVLSIARRTFSSARGRFALRNSSRATRKCRSAVSTAGLVAASAVLMVMA